MATSSPDIIVIGGGLNGLVCAALLARARRRVCLLEAQATVGGGAITGEIVSGFHAPRLTHALGPLHASVVDALQLRTRGVTFVAGDVEMACLDPSGGAIAIHADPARTARGLRDRSPHDAEAWERFAATRLRFGAVLDALLAAPPPTLDDTSTRDVWRLLQTLRAFRALPKAEAYRFLRWLPMPVADLLAEPFETELLRAGLAGDGIFASMLGPRSAGSGLLFLLKAAHDAGAPARTMYVEGGPGALTARLSEMIVAAGGVVRTNARVSSIEIDDQGRACGVTLDGGERMPTTTVVSGLDPKSTLLGLCDPGALPPEFSWRLGNLRTRGTLAKVNLALSSLPAFTGVDQATLTGRVRVGPTLDHLERAYDHAKYGRLSPEPWIEFTIPSLIDQRLAPPGAHVLSAYVQFAPYALRNGGPEAWDHERETLLAVTVRALERYAPGLERLVVGLEVITPFDLERGWGLTGGHVLHGELALDQLWAARPLLGWGNYRTPIDRLYLCGGGAHPGTGATGLSGLLAAKAVLAG